jgi:hypothetical protein
MRYMYTCIHKLSSHLRAAALVGIVELVALLFVNALCAKKTHTLFSSIETAVEIFPRVCPEPVLVK